MPKQKTRLTQPSRFQLVAPQIPEGYYSSSPNPNLPRFVEEHATPFDPAANAYNVPPFDKPITGNDCTPLNVNKLQRAFGKFKRKDKPELDWLDKDIQANLWEQEPP